MWDSTLPVCRLNEFLVRERRSFQPNSEEEYRLLGVRWYGQGCHIHDTYDGASLKAPVLTRLEPGDVVYNKMWASRGSFGVVSNDEGGSVATSEYPVFRSNEGLETLYLQYVMQQPRFWGLAKAWSSGTTGRARLNPLDFLAMPVPVPPLPEQRAITELLSAVDDTIRRSETYLNQLRLTKHQVMRELLTEGHPDFRGELAPLDEPWRIGRVAPTVESIPKDWQLVTLIDVARLESGHTPSRRHPEYWNGDTPWLSLGDTSEMKKLRVMNTAERVTQEGLDNSSARLLPTDTVVLSRTAVRGLCSRLGRPMATSQDFVAFVCGDRVLPAYLVQLFRHMNREWRRLEQGTSPTNKTLYFSVFRRLKVALPSTEEQQSIAFVGDSFDQRLMYETAVLDQLREAKRGLAQALLTGRLRVPVDSSGSRTERGA